MPADLMDVELRVFSTCAPLGQGVEQDNLGRIQEVARWSEEAGCEGMYIDTDNRQLDPWLVSQAIIHCTRRLCPLVAVEPTHMHPYCVAKMATSIACLHSRRVHLNMVASGFKADLAALNGHLGQDQRYDRLVEYAGVVRLLLDSAKPVSFNGAYYKLDRLRLTPPLPRALAPDILTSGLPAAGLDSARRLGTTPIEYPLPIDDYATSEFNESTPRGMRIGIVTRPEPAGAWAAARARFPEHRQGPPPHNLSMAVTEAEWHRQLFRSANSGASDSDPYWLGPFRNYKTRCPYLVGDYDTVAEHLCRYVRAGFRTIILDVASSPDELRHIGKVFRDVAELAEA
jgi:alkanesulfonate monooxygenase